MSMNLGSQMILNAKRYGFAVVGASSPDGGWYFGNDNIVNDGAFMPCSSKDSKDVPYFKEFLILLQKIHH